MATAKHACSVCGKPGLTWGTFKRADGTPYSWHYEADGVTKHKCEGESSGYAIGEPMVSTTSGAMPASAINYGNSKYGATVSSTGFDAAMANADLQQALAKADKLSGQFNDLIKAFAAFGSDQQDKGKTLEQKYSSLLTYVKDTEARWTAKLAAQAPVVIKYADTGKTIDLGRQHKQLGELISTMRFVRGKGIVFLKGEPGSMKTGAIPHVAKALGDLPYYVTSMSNQTSRAEFFGFMNGTGNYTDTPGYKCCVGGGVWLIDEIDNGNANGLTGLNTMATNDFVGFPNGETVQKHKDCYIIAAGNTVGGGADSKFIGRNQLDMATRTRFWYLEWDTDWEFVKYLVDSQWGTKAGAWVPKVKLLHDIAEKHKVEFCISSRVALIGAEGLVTGTVSEAKILEAMVWPGVSDDQRRVIEREYEQVAGGLSKKPWVTGEPEVSEYDLEDEDLESEQGMAGGMAGGDYIPSSGDMPTISNAVRKAWFAAAEGFRMANAVKTFMFLTGWSDANESLRVVRIWAYEGEWVTEGVKV